MRDVAKWQMKTANKKEKISSKACGNQMLHCRCCKHMPQRVATSVDLQRGVNLVVDTL
ncbi:unnamed protein product, partial [Ceratitis capitata]